MPRFENDVAASHPMMTELEPGTYAWCQCGKTRTVPKWVLVTHMFNHQTHHRGQVTTLLSQMGLDIGTTDIPFMPQFHAQA